MLVYSENEYETLREEDEKQCEDGGIYTGQWLGKLRHGYGHIKYSDQVEYEG